MKQKVIEIPLWERDVILIVGGDWHDILATAKKHKMCQKVLHEINHEKLRSIDRGAGYWCMENGIGLLWFPKNKVDIYTLVHEVTHIVDFLLMYICAETEMECRAYTTEWLMKAIQQQLKKM